MSCARQTQEVSKNPALLSQGEQALLMLTGEHPWYERVPELKK